MKRVLITALILMLSGMVLGGLFAASTTASIDISASGTAASGSTVTAWTSGKPQWSPIKNAVGHIGTPPGGHGGGLATVKVPAAPAGTWRITLYITNGHELVKAYSFLNMHIKVKGSVTASDGTATVGQVLIEDADGFTNSTLNQSETQILTPQKGSVTFYVDSADGTLVDTNNTVVSSGGDARAFMIGIQEGTFRVFKTNNDDYLDPHFIVEVDQS